MEKLYCVTLDVPDPIDFCADPERHAMVEIRATYEGKCYGGAYIVRVKSLTNLSRCRMEKTNTSGEGYVNVEFTAEVVILSTWSILIGTRIVQVEPTLLGLYDRDASAVVTTVGPRPSEGFAVDQLVPVRVYQSNHPPMQDRASVVGVFLTCDRQAQVYRLEGVLDRSAAAEAAAFLARIENELRAREELIARRREDLWFFELLLCHYRGEHADTVVDTGEGIPNWEGPWAVVDKGSDPVNILTLALRVAAGETVPVVGYWTRPLGLCRSSPLAARAAEPPEAWGPAVDAHPRAVLAEFLRNILDFLKATRELVETYDSKELIDGHLNLWGAMRSAQSEYV